MTAIDPSQLERVLAEKHAEIIAVETEWTAKTEQTAARSLGLPNLGDRQNWNRATWNRYLEAATTCQDKFLPKLRRLHAEVERLEKLRAAYPPGAVS
jgi:hypothetical protein